MEVPATTPVVPRRIAAACGLIVCVTGLVVFSGWVFDLPALTHIRPDWPNMAPAAALGFMLSGTALWLIAAAPERLSGGRLRLVWVCAVAIALLGSLKLAHYAMGLRLEFETLGFEGPASISPAAAVDFLLAGCALWLARLKRLFSIFQALALGGAFIGALGLASYLYGGEMLLPYAQMAIHTSTMFVLLNIGILCTRTEGGLLALLVSGTAGGRMALWMLALVPPVTVTIEWLEQRPEPSRWFGSGDPTPLFSLLDIIVLGALIWTAGAWLQRVDRRRALEETRRYQQETQLGLFVEYAPAAIAMLDRDMRYLAVSRRWLTDYRLETGDMVGRSHYDVFPETSSDWREVHRRCLAGASEKREEDLLRHADGSVDWVHWEMHPWRRRTGDVGGLVLFSEVVTDRVRDAERIRRLNRVYAVLSQINSLIVRAQDRQLLFDEACRIAVEQGTFTFAWIGLYYAATNEIRPVASTGHAGVSPAFTAIDVSDGSPDAQSVPALALRSRRAVFDNDIAAQRGTESDRYRELANAGYRSVVALPLIVDDAAVGVISMWATEIGFFDERELQLLRELAGDISFALQFLTKQEELNYISYFDVLTGLANRTLFLDRLNQQLRAHRSKSTVVALLLFDIERFSTLNDTYGRSGGDELLRLVAKRLQHASHGRENLARIGADRFALFDSEARGPVEIVHTIENMLLSCFTEPFAVAGSEVRISVRIGIAVSAANGADAETLLRNAETAIKEAKASGSHYLFHRAEMNAKAAAALTMEARLRQAVEAREFVLHYQPKVALGGGGMSGLEALLRWQSPGGGLVLPDKFIPILERTGLITAVGKWAVERALADFAYWTQCGCRTPRIAVNVSAVQLRQREFSSMIIDVIEASGVTPEALELEITESLIMQDITHSISTLSVLRDLGIHVAIDDFGTGYSSLSYLSRLPIDKIKIDRSFITAMLDSEQDRVVVSTIITLAHSFGLPVVAEGVETREQARALSELGCEEAQGYLFHKPLPAADIADLLLKST